MAIKDDIIKEITNSDLSDADKKDLLNQVEEIWSFEDSLPEEGVAI